jgi:hypothetical protein
MPLFKVSTSARAASLESGQAGEFVYSCSQAFKKGLADNVYFWPLTHEMIIKYQKPDRIYATWWTDDAQGRHQA